MWAWTRHPVARRCPAPIHTARRLCSRMSSGPCRGASATCRSAGSANTASASRTSCFRWTRPHFAVPPDVPVGTVPARQGRRKGACTAGPRRQHARLCSVDRRRTRDVKMASSFALNPGSIVAMDPGGRPQTLPPPAASRRLGCRQAMRNRLVHEPHGLRLHHFSRASWSQSVAARISQSVRPHTV